MTLSGLEAAGLPALGGIYSLLISLPQLKAELEPGPGTVSLILWSQLSCKRDQAWTKPPGDPGVRFVHVDPLRGSRAAFSTGTLGLLESVSFCSFPTRLRGW